MPLQVPTYHREQSKVPILLKVGAKQMSLMQQAMKWNRQRDGEWGQEVLLHSVVMRRLGQRLKAGNQGCEIWGNSGGNRMQSLWPRTGLVCWRMNKEAAVTGRKVVREASVISKYCLDGGKRWDQRAGSWEEPRSCRPSQGKYFGFVYEENRSCLEKEWISSFPLPLPTHPTLNYSPIYF